MRRGTTVGYVVQLHDRGIMKWMSWSRGGSQLLAIDDLDPRATASIFPSRDLATAAIEASARVGSVPRDHYRIVRLTDPT